MYGSVSVNKPPCCDVEVDGTYVGGKPKKGDGKVHKRRRCTAKAPVVALVERKGNVRTKVTTNVTAALLKDAVREQVERSARIITNEHYSYTGVGREPDGGHHAVTHSRSEFARDDINTNTVEAFFCSIKKLGMVKGIRMDPVALIILGGSFQLALPAYKTLCGILGKYAEPIAQAHGEIAASEIKAKYEQEKRQLEREAPGSLEARARITHIEKTDRYQSNLEGVLRQAALLFQELASVGTPPIGEWNDTYRGCAEEASSEEIRMLWAKVLVEEYQMPGTFSRRVLKVLQNISREEAEHFSKFLTIAVADEYLISGSNAGHPFDYAGLLTYDAVQMVNAGFISSQKTLIQFEEHPASGEERAWGTMLHFPERIFLVHVYADERPDAGLYVRSLTDVGKALATVIPVRENNEAVKRLLHMLKAEGYKITFFVEREEDDLLNVVIDDMTPEQIEDL